ncbi:MAG: DNA-processing protein DprA [Lachnospiraceae bacterium]|nr:DNA-processing protein DprA [Lachnospiraceae bacterium]
MSEGKKTEKDLVPGNKDESGEIKTTKDRKEQNKKTTNPVDREELNKETYLSEMEDEDWEVKINYAGPAVDERREDKEKRMIFSETAGTTQDNCDFGEIDRETICADIEIEKLVKNIRAAEGLEADKYIMQFVHAGLSRNQIITLFVRFGSIRAAYNAEAAEIIALKALGPEAPERFLNVRNSTDVEEEWERVAERGIHFVSFIDRDYPARLEEISEPPVGLFVIGKLPVSTTPAIAIVGSRECSTYGKEVAIDVAKKLARAGIDVISGMAAGIDGFAHRGALNGGGDTFAILGCGVDICYPRENVDIYTRMKTKGGIISEYYPGTQPVSFNFPRRNRLIAALSDGILVVEARQRSGSWITVDYGLEQGKDIYAIPGRIVDRLSMGCNNLIRSGAKAVTKAADIIEDLAPKYLAARREGDSRNCDVTMQKKANTGTDSEENGKKLKDCLHVNMSADENKDLAAQVIGNLSEDEAKVFKCLETAGSSIDKICADSGLQADVVIRNLTMLEIRGVCVKLGNDGYARKL